jgi:hypothetical protein
MKNFRGEELRLGTAEYKARKKRLDWDARMGPEMLRIMRRFASDDVVALKVYELFQKEVVAEALRKHPTSVKYRGPSSEPIVDRVIEREIHYRLGRRRDRAGWVRNRAREIKAAFISVEAPCPASDTSASSPYGSPAVDSGAGSTPA